jgi:hypothetical protein
VCCSAAAAAAAAAAAEKNKKSKKVVAESKVEPKETKAAPEFAAVVAAAKSKPVERRTRNRSVRRRSLSEMSDGMEEGEIGVDAVKEALKEAFVAASNTVDVTMLDFLGLIAYELLERKTFHLVDWLAAFKPYAGKHVFYLHICAHVYICTRASVHVCFN